MNVTQNLKVKQQNNRASCHDVFNASLFERLKFDKYADMPMIKPVSLKPEKLIAFSECLRAKDFDCWVHFYEDDYKFERIWNNPKRYLDRLKKFKGVITPDFSVYRDMPIIMQAWNIFRNKAFGSWLQENGVNVIPNVRFGDERTRELACAGLSHESIISFGTNGVIKNPIDREITHFCIEEIIVFLHPKILIIFGPVTDKIKRICLENKVEILHFYPSHYLQNGKGDL